MGKFLALCIIALIMLSWIVTRTLPGAMFLAIVSDRILK